MALLMVMTVCLLVYAALEYRIRTALKEHAATFPDQKGKRIQNPTARWVFHYFGGFMCLYPRTRPSCSQSHRRVLYLNPAANAAGAVGSRPRDVNRTVLTSSITFPRPGACRLPCP